MVAPWRWLRVAATIAAMPALALAVLVALGALEVLPALLAFLAVAAAALGTAWLWLGNLARLADRLRDASSGAGLPLDDGRLLPAVREVAEGVTRLTRSLAERGALVEQLRRADAAILESLPDPLLVLGADRALLRANAAARTLLGLSAAAGARGAQRNDAAALLRHPVLAEAIDGVLRDGAPRAADILLPVPLPRDIAAQVIPMVPPLADGGALILVLGDRTRERAVERMRADFVANASHELRTPLASLIGFIETLRGPAEDDAAARARFLGIMADQAARMRTLIDDLLDLSRIELSQHQAPEGEADLAAIARAEAAAMAPILAERAVRLAVDGPAQLAVRPADAGQLAQVVRNLLENAVRHGREGGAVTLRLAEGPRGGVALVVEDDGPGIAREHLPRLTERFYRVDAGRGRGGGGTGLGLAIVKHIVIRHRGELRIDSPEAGGARFSVWLPGRVDSALEPDATRG